MRLCLALLCLLALPSAASAAEVHIADGAVVYTAAAGEVNQISVGGVGAPASEFVFTDQNTATQVAAPCVHENVSIRCPASGLTVARFDLGDGDDSLSAEQDGDVITFEFSQPMCVGNSVGMGKSTFFFGAASNKPPHEIDAGMFGYGNPPFISLKARAPNH